MITEKIINTIKYKNRDLILAYLRRNYNKDNPVYYEDIERELGIKKDYLCHLLKPLRELGLVLINDIQGNKIHSPHKEIHLSDFGKHVVDNITEMWLTNKESRWLLFLGGLNNSEMSSLKNSCELVENLLYSSKEDVHQIVTSHVAGHVKNPVLAKVLAEDVAKDILSLLIERIDNSGQINTQASKIPVQN